MRVLSKIAEKDWPLVQRQIEGMLDLEESTGRSKRVFAYQILPQAHKEFATRKRIEEFTEVEERSFPNAMAASIRLGYPPNSNQVGMTLAKAKRERGEVEAEVGGIVWRYIEDMPD